METINGWIKSSGMCPNCLTDVVMVATQRENGWDLREVCTCKHINSVLPWPFKTKIATSVDFIRLGFEYELDEDYADLLVDQDEDYLNEVDNGWDAAYFDAAWE